MFSASPGKSMSHILKNKSRNTRTSSVIISDFFIPSFSHGMSILSFGKYLAAVQKIPYHSIFPDVFIKILVYSFVVVISHDTMKNLVKSSLRKSSSFPLNVFADWNDVWRNSQSEAVNSTRFDIHHSEELTNQITIKMISYDYWKMSQYQHLHIRVPKG